MARCKDCIHEKVCLHRVNIQTDTYAYMGVKYDTEKCEHYTSADVVPKSVYDATQHLLKGAYERVEQLDKLCGDLQKSKQEVAREIFEGIEKLVVRDDFHKYVGYPVIAYNIVGYAELKKKYTESESILGECKFDEKIHTEPLDLSDAKFIDEDGNVTTPADWQDWNETPPWEESEGNDGNT